MIIRAMVSFTGTTTGTRGSLRKPIVLLLAAAVFIIILGSLASAASDRAQEEAKKMELQGVQQAVSLMMADNRIATLPNPVVLPTNDMTLFPDAATPPEAKGLLQGERAGYVLHGHDNTRDGQPEPTVDYIGSPRTTWTYTATRDGVVVQGDMARND